MRSLDGRKEAESGNDKIMAMVGNFALTISLLLASCDRRTLTKSECDIYSMLAAEEIALARKEDEKDGTERERCLNISKHLREATGWAYAMEGCDSKENVVAMVGSAKNNSDCFESSGRLKREMTTIF